jgi:phosphoribosyl-ATP pyrophosphohydrolase
MRGREWSFPILQSSSVCQPADDKSRHCGKVSIDGTRLLAPNSAVTMNPLETLSRLEAVIRERRGADPASSYVAKLSARGRKKMAQKLGEEAVETAIAAIAEGREEMICESADLLFHLMILLADMDISIGDVCSELDRRDGISGLDEKASRAAK